MTQILPNIFNRSPQPPIVCLVVPCFNEEEVIAITANRLTEVLRNLIKDNHISKGSFVYFVDDGSHDRTWAIIEQLHTKDNLIKGLKLARNFGHQNALLAGLLSIKERCDCAISIDADLQQDENAIPLFLDKFKSGAEIVFGIRHDRKSDGLFKKLTALFFYKLMSSMGVRIIKNHADYRLVGKKALYALAEHDEFNLFLRGIFTEMGFKTDQVMFEVKERFAGKTKYSLRKMLSLALNGITSFSIVPLRLVTLTGVLIFILSIIMSGYVVYQATFNQSAVPGWASTVLPIYFIGGIQLLGIGLLGEYIGKIYKEVKARPRFIRDAEVF